MVTSSEIRKRFLEFFKAQGHEVRSSSALVPHNDPSLMFTNSGMVQFKNVFLGKEESTSSRVTTSQKCVRAGGKHNDLDNVGHTARHHTFFEMLGNFSFGDYFKEMAIKYAWDFITKELSIDRNKLYFTVYHNDDEAFRIWKSILGSEERIIRIATNDNFWSMGDTGPCGPCSEIFYDHGSHIEGGLPGTANADGDRYVEIWNLVFMQYEKLASGQQIDLQKKSIDTGAGLERIAAVLQGVHNNYDSDILRNIINYTEEVTAIKQTSANRTSFRVIADHLRSCAFLISDGVMPANDGRGYVLRRILRRAVRHVNALGYKGTLLHQLLPILIGEMGGHYNELLLSQELIVATLRNEEELFCRTLDNGLSILDKALSDIGPSKSLSGEVAFKLHDTFGFPVDLTADILKEKHIQIDMNSFEKHMAIQKQKAKESWKGSGTKEISKLWFDLLAQCGPSEFLGYTITQCDGKVIGLIQGEKEVSFIDNKAQFFMITNQTVFYGESGGQIGDIGHGSIENTHIAIIDTIKPVEGLHVHVCKLEKDAVIRLEDIVHLTIDVPHRQDIKRNHTATHLLHATLRNKLGKYVTQKGSLVTSNRLRFDFNYSGTVARTILDDIENEINSMILNNITIESRFMDKDLALEEGALALFGEKYHQQVRVVSIQQNEEKYSVELCGGTHVDSLGEIGLFRIVSESAIAAGIRRIEAITGRHAFTLAQQENSYIRQLLDILKVQPQDLHTRVESLLAQNKEISNQNLRLKEHNLLAQFENSPVTEILGTKITTVEFSEPDLKDLKNVAQNYLRKRDKHVLFLLNKIADKVNYFVAVKDAEQKTKADNLFKFVFDSYGIRGGGNFLFAQGSGAYLAKDLIELKLASFFSGS